MKSFEELLIPYDLRFMQTMGVKWEEPCVPVKQPDPQPQPQPFLTVPRQKLVCCDCRFRAKDCYPNSTTRCNNYVVSCACWKTGKYVWVEGCKSHPRESMT